VSNPVAEAVPGFVPLREELLGLRATHVEPIDAGASLGAVSLHPQAARALAGLRRDASAAGFDLRAVSGYRSFERQLQIWNGKALGARELLDENELPLDALSLAPAARVQAILRWSALPGCSRHHWGTEIDVVDAAALRAGEAPRLLRRECEAGGAYEGLHRWLDARIAAGEAGGFFRPYVGRDCAIAAEPWHLSFAPLAARCQAAFDAAALRGALRLHGIELREQVEQCLEDILVRYVILPARLYPEPWRDVVGNP
jgi:hypothetical protein